MTALAAWPDPRGGVDIAAGDAHPLRLARGEALIFVADIRAACLDIDRKARARDRGIEPLACTHPRLGLTRDTTIYHGGSPARHIIVRIGEGESHCHARIAAGFADLIGRIIRKQDLKEMHP